MTFPSPRYTAARNNLYKALVSVRTYLAAKAGQSVEGYQSELQAIADSDDGERQLYDRIAALILIYALWAYEDGLQEANADPLAVTAAQGQVQSAVSAWAAQQTTYADGLAQAMANNTAIQNTPVGMPLPVLSGGSGAGTGFPDPTGSEVMTAEIQQASAAAIVERVGMWAESLRAFRLDGMVKGAELGGDDPIVAWILGPTDEHCQSDKGMTGCLELSKMPPMRLSDFVTAGWVPRAPGNEEITCHGWNCLCSLVRVADGKQVM